MRSVPILVATWFLVSCTSPPIAGDTERWGGRPYGVVHGPGAFWRKAVAPVFEHGFGFAWKGNGLAPDPTLLSEATATEFIRTTLAAYGIHLSERRVVVYHGASKYPDGARARRAKYWESGGGPWVMDLVDPERRIAVEFISEDDVSYLESCEDTRSSGYGYGDTLLAPAAESVAGSLREADVDPYTYLVFYDPTDDPEFVQLNAQLMDAVRWLRERGALGSVAANAENFVDGVDLSSTGLHQLSADPRPTADSCSLGDHYVIREPDPALNGWIESVKLDSGHRRGHLQLSINLAPATHDYFERLKQRRVPGIALVHENRVRASWTLTELTAAYRWPRHILQWSSDPDTIRAIHRALTR